MKLKKIDITEIKGFRLGNAENKIKGTGCTTIICEDGAVGGVDVRGGAPATRDTDLLRSENTVDKVNAVVISGGSAFGLESASGVMRALADKGIGFKIRGSSVPIVCGASLFDLEVGDSRAFPDINMGIDSVRNAYRGGFRHGVCGAGTGATVGKMFGIKRAMKSGLGTFACGDDRIQVGAIAAVNAMGDIYNSSGNIIAGLRSGDGTSVFGTIRALKRKVYEGMGADISSENASASDENPSAQDGRQQVRRSAGSQAAANKKAPAAKPAPAKKKVSPEDSTIARAIEAEYIKKKKSELEALKRKLESGEFVRDRDTADVQKSAAAAEERKTAAAPVKAAPVITQASSLEDEYLTLHDNSFTAGGRNSGKDFRDLTIPGLNIETRQSTEAEEEDALGYDIPFNTTVGCLITNAILTKSQANKLASILHDAYARAIKPVHSTLDGDTIFVLSTCTQEVNFDAFAALATDVMQYAIIDGAASARGAYGLPAAGEL